MRCSSAPAAVVGELERLCRELTTRGWPARIVTSCLCGEADVRLQVGRIGSAVVVELLGPYGETPVDQCWHAVRIDPTSRLVWRGPRRPCDPARVLRLVEDLLCSDGDDLPGRYSRLG